MKCLICGKEHNNKKYCSEQCQYEAYRVKKVERVNIKCLNCGEEFEILKTKQKKYCSRKCVDEHKKITYLGENNPMFNYDVSDDTRKKHSEASKMMWRNQDVSDRIKKRMKEHNENSEYPNGWSNESRERRIKTTIEKFGVVHNFMNEGVRDQANKTCMERYGKMSYELMLDGLHKTNITSIEKIFENFLIINDIKYEKQFRIYFKNEKSELKFRSYDFYLIDKKTIVEIDGDYWHGNPMFFKKLNETQLKNKANDIFKDELVIIKNLNIIRFWEVDIHNNNYEQKILSLYGKNKD